jgi:thiol-disulfide isomerase/thioredoxin
MERTSKEARMRRRHLLAALAAPALAFAWPGGRALAAPDTLFSQFAFDAAQAAGRPILVDVWASWCPICAKQAPTLATLAADPAFKDLVVLKVDFDTQKDVVRAFGVRMQSTLIVFHGTKETARAVGETNPGAIRALLASGLG